MGYLKIPDSYKEILGMTADEYANSKTAGLDEKAQSYLDSYKESAELKKQALENNKNNVITQYQNQKPNIQTQAKEQSKQAYINNMLNSKAAGNELERAGLSHTGVVGSTYSDLANAYSENLNKISTTKNSALREVDNNIANAESEYGVKEQELLADIINTENAIKQQNEQATAQRYQEAINNYMQYKGLEQYINSYNQNEDSLRAAEKEREYNRYLAQQELELKRKQINSELEAYKEALEISNNPVKSEYQLATKKENDLDNIDKNSVIKLGYGPISKTELDRLVNKGEIVASAENGIVTYSKPDKTNQYMSKLNQMFNRY